MVQQDELEAQLRASQEALEQLRSEFRISQRQLTRALELLDKQQLQLTTHETSIARLDRILMELLSGRVWRTLSATGNLVKRILPSRYSSTSEMVARGRENSYLVCDEPKARDLRPRSGTISVRGWALAKRGVDCIQVEILGLPVVEVVPSVVRPDVKKSHPDLDRTGRSGFVAELNTLPLPNGRHSILVRLISKSSILAEVRTAVTIDHEKGFASDYERWIHEFEHPDDEVIELKLMSVQCRPLISVLMPVYNTNPAELAAAIQSVVGQSYSNWELCIADDCSSEPAIREILESFAGQDKRIKVAYQTERGGISRACNAAWRLANGDYVCFLDHDDTLAPHALAYVCEALDKSPDADLLYSDEDKIDERGKRSDPFFKPDWSPDLLLSENYMCHLLILRQDLANKIGHLNPDRDGSQDYDLILRASEQAANIQHISRVLYHWRRSEYSTATTLENKQYALNTAREALEERCKRAAAQARVEPGIVPGRWRVRYAIPAGTRVSIIIASGGKADVLRDNLDSIFSKTTYRDFEVVIIDNSRQNIIENFVREQQQSHPALRYLDWRNKPFNYSVINNTGARRCESPVLLFLNDDTSVINPEWLEAMLELAVRPEVGAVGSKLLYPDGRIQHAGVIMGLYDNCGHAFKALEGSVSHYFDFSDVIRNVSAVTGACLMTRADVFWQVGGFDEGQFAVAFNDIDLSLKIGSAGYRVLYTPHAQLYHYEAFSKTARDLVPHPEEVAAMRSKWDKVIVHDPYYSPNLTRNEEDYSFRTRI
ncbi:MAG TPA: glycosyltransferase family 2 protein [Bryobacteraceae bacterium]|jgi:GT2 family glycosyltransferase